MAQDLLNRRYGKLTVVKYNRSYLGNKLWDCICDCGGYVLARTGHLNSGSVKSCGCIKIEVVTRLGKSHLNLTAKSKHPLYKIWSGMWNRCTRPTAHEYKNYGGRGITVCIEWKDFNNFVRDMGPRPSIRHTLDRKDNNGNYNKNNCKWSTWKEQANNRRNSYSNV